MLFCEGLRIQFFFGTRFFGWLLLSFGFSTILFYIPWYLYLTSLDFLMFFRICVFDFYRLSF